ncbi:pilus assembly protein PilM [bacterium]|nr:pilus assembly protein PilM [bacterium]
MAEQKQFVGVDILDTYFPEYVVLKKDQQILSLSECGEILDIRKKIADLRNKADKISVSIPRDKVLMRTFEIVSADMTNIDKLVENEVRKTIPLEIEDLYYKYHVMQQEEDKIMVLFAGVTKNQLDYYISILKRLGLEDVVIGVSSASYYNCFLFNYKDVLANKVYYLLHIGTRTVEICIIANGVIVFTKSLNLGADAIAHYIEEYLDINFEKAQQIAYSLKKSGETLSDEDKDKVVKALQDWNDRLFHEIDLSIKFYKAKYPGSNVSEILVSGCGIPLTNIKETVMSKLGLTINDLDPFKNLAGAKNIKMNVPDLSETAMFLPMGLALQSAGLGEINFDFYLKKEEKPKEKIAVKLDLFNKVLEFFKGNVTAFVGIGIVGVFIFISIFLKISYVKKHKEFVALTKEYEKIKKMSVQNKSRKERMFQIDKYSKDGKSVWSYINFIVSNMEDEIFLTKISYSKFDKVVIDGKCKSKEQLLTFISNLKKDNYFIEVKTKDEGLKKWVNFQLICQLKKS